MKQESTVVGDQWEAICSLKCVLIFFFSSFLMWLVICQNDLLTQGGGLLINPKPFFLFSKELLTDADHCIFSRSRAMMVQAYVSFICNFIIQAFTSFFLAMLEKNYYYTVMLLLFYQHLDVFGGKTSSLLRSDFPNITFSQETAFHL